MLFPRKTLRVDGNAKSVRLLLKAADALELMLRDVKVRVDKERQSSFKE